MALAHASEASAKVRVQETAAPAVAYRARRVKACVMAVLVIQVEAEEHKGVLGVVVRGHAAERMVVGAKAAPAEAVLVMVIKRMKAAPAEEATMAPAEAAPAVIPVQILVAPAEAADHRISRHL